MLCVIWSISYHRS